MELAMAIAKFAVGTLTSEEAIAAASLALDRGVYSDALAELVCQNPVWSDVGPLFNTVLGELGIVVPSRPEALSRMAREYARQIVQGGLSPNDGARRIWWEVANDRDADSSFLIFVGLASEWEDDKEHRPQYDAQIVQEARRLLDEGGKAELEAQGERG